MSKIISTNKLNRLWANGIKPTVDKVKNTIKDRSGLMSNSEENKLVDALAIKEAIDYYNVAKNAGKQYSTLEEFVEDTAKNINVPSVGRFKDIAGFVTGSSNWYRYMIVYQNAYQQGSSSSVSGNGIFWNDQKRMWNVFIHGNKDSGLTATYKEIGTPTIKTRQDLMANAVSGLFPDALAVKDAINTYMPTRYTSNSYATVEEFTTIMAGEGSELNTIPFKAGSFKDTGSWGPKKSSGFWYRYLIVVQNEYSSGQTFETTCNGFFISGDNEFWSVSIKGKKDTGLSVTYKSLTTTNSADDKVKTTTCKLYGATVEGELVYKENVADYYTIGNILYIGIRISIQEVIKHPEGSACIAIDLPDILTKKQLMRDSVSSLHTSFTKGGYKNGFRRISCANAVKHGTTGIRFLLRSFMDRTDIFSPSLVEMSFTSNISDTENQQASFVHLLTTNGVLEDNQLFLSGFVMLKDK